MTKVESLKTQRLLILDFDGVICDSIHECWITSGQAYNTFNERNNKSEKIDLNNEEFKKLFYKYRFFVRPAGEYFLLLHLLNKYGEIKEEKYIQGKKKYHSEIEKFTDFFFDTREKLRKGNMDAWLRLHSPFLDFMEFWENMRGDERIYIATNKDIGSIYLILRHWNIEFDEGRVFSKEMGMDKKALILNILAREGCSPAKTLFVDDHIHTLMVVKPLGIKVGLASWGFVHPDAPLLAKREGIPVLRSFWEIEKSINENCYEEV